ncbi:MAG: PD40 domain-containing protein, partial [Gemmatimonadetes bacterium]|nr:PD40 domain-containing protein [Gemmatimonadota bacterium]
MITSSIIAPPEVMFRSGQGLVLSPDGSHLAFIGRDADETDSLWIRPLDSRKARRVQESTGAYYPFWSPDSRWIGFTVDDSILKVATEGGEPLQIIRHHDGFGSGTGLSWGEGGRIVFTAGQGAIYEVSDRGGTASLLLGPEPEIEQDLHDPQLLPGGRGILFVVHRILEGGTPRNTGGRPFRRGAP